jgi:hypothetical protein
MRASEFLLEYNRQITARNVGTKLLWAVRNDFGILPNETFDAINHTLSKIPTVQEIVKSVQDGQIQLWIDEVLNAIEQLDPAPNNQYTQWLARMYAKGDVKFEDLNRMNMLGLHFIGKKRNLIRPEDKDINRFKTYSAFESTMMANYDLEKFTDTEEKSSSKTNSSKVYEDEDVIVVIPHDEDAACKYGRQTRWCTAATKGYNYFDQYDRKGPLYILIPKKPQYPSEKYQLHFETSSYMDYEDVSVDLKELLTERFPNLYDFFLKTKPEMQYSYSFLMDYEVEELFKFVKSHIPNMIEQIIEKKKYIDKDYLTFLEYEGLVDSDGEVDWDRVEELGYTYEEYNDDLKDIEEIVDEYLDPKKLWYSDDAAGHYERLNDVRQLPYFMGMDLYWLTYMSSYNLSYDASKIISELEDMLSDYKLIKSPSGKWRLTKK